MRPTRIRSFILAAAVFTLGAAACDSRELLAPNGRSLAPRGYLSEPQPLGSGYLAAPPNSSPASVAGIGWDPLQAFPDSAWIVVNVTGNATLTYNKAQCDAWAETMPFWPCMTGDPFDAFGSQPWDGGTVSIRGYYDGGGGGYTAVKLRGTGGTGAVGLFFARGAGSLTGRYNMRALWAWDPTYGNGPWSYNIAGGYTVTATAVPAPFGVTESAPDADGVVTYTVEPLYGLQFTTPVNGWPAGATFWAFYPGDSLPDRPDLSWPGWQITECQFKLVCQWKPPIAGRMQVLAHLEDQPAYARSKPEGNACGSGAVTVAALRAACVPPPQDPAIKLSCDKPAPVRGDTISCTARAQPNGASMSELVWSFVDSAGHTIPGPAAASDTAWKGEMAVSGLMRVAGKVNAVPSSDSVRIGVRPRTWARIRLDPKEKGHGDLPYPPAASGDLAHTHVDTLDSTAPIPAHEIADGPNKGWAFVDSIPTVPVTTHLSRAWQSTDPWFQMQHHGVAGLDINGNTAYFCTQSQIPTLLTLARRHEGAGLHQTNSHVDVFEQYVQHHKQHEEVERQVVYMPDLAGVRTLKEWFRDDVWKVFIINPLMNDPRQGHTNQTTLGVVPPAYFPCQPRF